MTALDRLIDAAVAAGDLPGLHAVIVRLGQHVLAERYHPGPDQSWGERLGVIAHGPTTRHDLRAVSGSIVALLYGIALARGQVPPPETPLFVALADYPDLAADPARHALAIDHALDMTLGLAWDDQTSEMAMEQAADRMRFVLSRPVIARPGDHWHPCAGATALLGAIIARGTGQSLATFARQTLFAPLGIDDVEWLAAPPNGVESAASGLRLRAPDLANLGARLLDGSGPVPPGWVARCRTPRVSIEPTLFYSCHWYQRVGRRANWWGAIGNGGQHLILLPDHRITIVILCGNYDSQEHRGTPQRLLRDIIFPTLLG